MAHFFFHFHEGQGVETDEIGIEFASAEQAYLEAVAAARALWPELLAARRDPEHCAFEIVDADGEVLFHFPFSELRDQCRPASAARRASRELHELIHETHRRAWAAREEVRSGIDQVHRSLSEMTSLMNELSRFEPRQGSFGAARPQP